MRRAAAAALLLAAACGPGRDESRPHKAFVPLVIQSRLPGRIPWQTYVEISNPGASPALVRLTRWPPDARANEVEEFAVPPGPPRKVPLRIPPFPTVSSFLFESREPFAVRAVVRDRKGDVPEPLEVPVVEPERLARPGDTLRVGPLFSDSACRSHFAYTFPATERDAVPFRVRVAVVGADGTPLGTFEEAIHGVPQVVEDPWLHFGLRDRRPIYVEVTLLGGTRGRKPVWGLWVYGIVTDKVTSVSSFAGTTVRRGG